jgi:hypothetical protein
MFRILHITFIWEYNAELNGFHSKATGNQQSAMGFCLQIPDYDAL